MEVIRIPHIVQSTCKAHLAKGRSIGFVPTMGALHEGHMSLIKRARPENEVTVASIFVNPLQFGPSEDFERYPRDLENDIEKLSLQGIDLLFLPDQANIYPKGHTTFVSVGELSEKLCGSFRPGHFRGVATVVAKLFNIVRPTRAYFGQKDFQQTVIIRKMAKDLNFDVDVIICPTVREHDGLAMSSRNRYLSAEQRAAALALHKSLLRASEALSAGVKSPSELGALMEGILREEPLISGIDYASAYDPGTLDVPDELSGEVLLAVAARLGSVRLIDNMLVTA